MPLHVRDDTQKLNSRDVPLGLSQSLYEVLYCHQKPYNHICEGIKVQLKMRCSFAPIPPGDNLFQNLSPLMDFNQNLPIPSLFPVVWHISLYFHL